MKILVTGATGFLGKNLLTSLLSEGFEIIATTRSLEKNCYKQKNLSWVEYSHQSNGSNIILPYFEVVVHLAYDFSIVDPEAAFLADKRIIDYCYKHSVFQIYVSSFSAHTENPSFYASVKRRSEDYCKHLGITIVRPGLIFSKGGNAQKMFDYVNKMPILPLIGGGNQKVAIVHAEDICRAVSIIVNRRLLGEFDLFIDPRPTLKDLYNFYFSKIKRRALVYIPIPVFLVELLLPLLTLIGMKISKDNILGLEWNSRIERTPSWKDVGIEPRSIQECLKNLIN